MNPNFQFSSYYSYDQRSYNRNIFFQKYWFFENWPAIKNNLATKIENQALQLFADFNSDYKLSLFLF